MAKKVVSINTAKKISMAESIEQFAAAWATMGDQSSHVAHVCNAAMKHFQGDTPDRKATSEYADGVGTILGWSKDRRADAGKYSRVRKWVRNYIRIPTAVEKVKSDSRWDGTLTHHNVDKLATFLNQEHVKGGKRPTDTAVVNYFIEAIQGSGGAKPKAEKATLQQLLGIYERISAMECKGAGKAEAEKLRKKLLLTFEKAGYELK